MPMTNGEEEEKKTMFESLRSALQFRGSNTIVTENEKNSFGNEKTDGGFAKSLVDVTLPPPITITSLGQKLNTSPLLSSSSEEEPVQTQNISPLSPSSSSSSSPEPEPVQITPVKEKIKKAKRRKYITRNKTLRTIKKIQRKKKPILPREMVYRLIRHYALNETNQRKIKFKASAVLMIRDILEHRLLKHAQAAHHLALLNKKKTLMPKHMQMASQLIRHPITSWTSVDFLNNETHI